MLNNDMSVLWLCCRAVGNISEEMRDKLKLMAFSKVPIFSIEFNEAYWQLTWVFELQARSTQDNYIDNNRYRVAAYFYPEGNEDFTPSYVMIEAMDPRPHYSHTDVGLALHSLVESNWPQDTLKLTPVSPCMSKRRQSAQAVKSLMRYLNGRGFSYDL